MSSSRVPFEYMGQMMLIWSYSYATLPRFTSIMWSVLSIRNLERRRNRNKEMLVNWRKWKVKVKVERKMALRTVVCLTIKLSRVLLAVVGGEKTQTVVKRCN